MTTVKVINKSRHKLPQYATPLAAGMDIRANLDSPFALSPGQRAIIPTGLYLSIPEGFEVQLRPRSGLAAKHGITVLNAPGTIDADYRGEVGVILINLSDRPFVIEDGERIAQMVLAAHATIRWEPSDTLDSTERGAGGFGSTGKE
jgi:dUTP pyrophosphatase